MSSVKTPNAPLLLCAGLLLVGSLFVGPTSVSAQVQPVELPQRVAAPFMSYQGAVWLERPERVAEEMPDAMVAIMGLEDGDVVADIGAGSGFFTRRMARLVAPTGTVYAVDIQPEMLEILQGYVEEEGITGVVPVLSEFDDPKLPEGEIDWILLVDVYHEFGNHEAMLTKMREALKSDGRVALLEYRVEDGTGDHIKGDHRMSVRQVLSEWGPAGFELVELHEFLPSQHLFIFRTSRDDGTAQVMAHYDLLEAISEGHIEVTASNLGLETVDFTLNRTRPEPMVITLPVGTYFETSGRTSDLIARRDGVVVLLEDGPQVWRVLARNVHPTLPDPGPQDEFEIQSADRRIGMRDVMWLYQGMNLQAAIEPLVQQLSLWIASDDPGYDQLAEQVSSSPYPAGEIVALAVAYTDSSGTDVTRKRIWAERERFVPALSDPGLRSFFETR
jgi:SAM-dependent methyltransferase